MKLIISLVCLILGVLILAKYYGVNPNELNPTVVKDLLIRAFYDLRDAVFALVERLKAMGSSVAEKK